jgi:hypothetical protein
MPKIFWMVWLHDSPTTNHRHDSYPGAKKEADRIARLNPGKKVYVLEAMDYRMVELPPIVTVDL